MNDVLLNLMQHMRWADTLVADALDDDAPADVGRAVRPHRVGRAPLVRAHSGRTPAFAVWPSLTVAESRALATEHADLFERLVQSADDVALARPVHYRNSAGRAYQSAVSDIVTHVAMHGSHHRGQILQRLRAAGREPPYVDFIQFMRRDQG